MLKLLLLIQEVAKEASKEVSKVLPKEVNELVRPQIERIQIYAKRTRAKFGQHIIKNCSENYGKLLLDQGRVRDAKSLQEQIHSIELALESILQEFKL